MWCCKAAGQGDTAAKAMLWLGAKGQDMDPPRHVEAVGSCVIEGSNYDQGRGVDRDDDLAVKNYRKAADKGHKDAHIAAFIHRKTLTRKHQSHL